MRFAPRALEQLGRGLPALVELRTDPDTRASIVAFTNYAA
jgi:hypothetical protein